MIGDVAGRGLQAASLMSQLRNALRAYAFEAHPPAAALEHLNSLAWRREGVVMATLIYLVLDPGSGSRAAGERRPPPAAAGEAGRDHRVPGGGTLASAGRRAATKYAEAEYLLEPGSTLLLYTDGLIEKRSTPIDDGMEQPRRGRGRRGRRPRGALRPPARDAFPAAEDDVALLALESVPLAAERMELTLPAEPLELSSLRRALQRWLAAVRGERRRQLRHRPGLQRGVSRTRSNTRMVPVMRRSTSMPRSRDDEVAITVRDYGRWREPRGDHRGRGLGLIETVMDSVSVVTTPNEGTEVHMMRKLGRSGDEPT